MFNSALRGASEPYARFVCFSCLLQRNALLRRPANRNFSESQIGGRTTQIDGSQQKVKATAEPNLSSTSVKNRGFKTVDPVSPKDSSKLAPSALPESKKAQDLKTKGRKEPKGSNQQKKKHAAAHSHSKTQKEDIMAFSRTLEEVLKGSIEGALSGTRSRARSKGGTFRRSVTKLSSTAGIKNDHALQNKSTSAVQTKQGSQKKKGTDLQSDFERGLTQRGTSKGNICKVDASTLSIQPVHVDNQPQVPSLSYGLDRVLFNPGVYHLQDPRSRVYNFDPYLQSIMPVAEFDFNALKEYITSSRDDTLLETARKYGKKYLGSSSSMTSALSHFHFLLSHWRELNTDTLSQGFPTRLKTFTILTRRPSAIFLRWKGDAYAIDADKEFDTANILSMLGKSMEKLLTLSTEDFERYRKSSAGDVSEAERTAPESFHFSTFGDFLMRSQLDAHDPRLPGTGMFDLKTRAVVSIRMDTDKYEKGLGYEIKSRYGEWESFEREYFDMVRAAFLKYSLQVRMGRMDGIFVAFHNTERIFGFQYISLPEMDSALHGTAGTTSTGDQEFVLSLELLNKIFDRATAKFPRQSLRIHFETRDTQTPFMYVFAEPVTEEQITEIQTKNRAKIEEFERTVLGLGKKYEPTLVDDIDDTNRETQSEWDEIQAKVEQEVKDDENLVSEATTSPGALKRDPDDSLSENPVHPSSQAEVDGQESVQATVLEDGEHEEGNEDDEHDNLEVRLEEENGGEDERGVEDRSVDGSEPSRRGAEEFNKRMFPSEEENAVLGSQILVKGSNLSDETPRIVEVKEATPKIEASGANADEELAAAGQREQQKNAPDDDRGLLAMTLTVRNKVNGNYVLRPDELSARDKWTVEYSLAEVATSSRAWSLYGACQTRRRKALEAEDEDEEAVSYYIRKLREMSEQGRVWRKNQDKIDAEMGLRVLRDSTPTRSAGQLERSDSSELPEGK